MPNQSIANLARLNSNICHLLTLTPDMQTPGIDFFSDPNWPNQLPNETIKLESLPQESQSKQIQAERNMENSMQDIYRTYFSESKTEKKAPESVYMVKQQENQRSDYIFFLPQSNDKKGESSYQVKKEQGEMSSNQLEDDEGSSENYSEKKRNLKYNILSKASKLFLVNQIQYIGVTSVAKMYGVSVNNLCRWKKTCDRKVGAGRKVNDQQLERRLIDWVNEQKSKDGGLNLTRKLIQDKARKWSSDLTFKASKGWFQRFVTRNKQLELMQMFGIKLKCDKIKKEEIVNLPSQLFPCSTKGTRVSERLKVKKENLKKQDQIYQQLDQ